MLPERFTLSVSIQEYFTLVCVCACVSMYDQISHSGCLGWARAPVVGTGHNFALTKQKRGMPVQFDFWDGFDMMGQKGCRAGGLIKIKF